MERWERAWLAAVIDSERSRTHSYCGSKYCKRAHYRLSIGNVNHEFLLRTAKLIGFGKISKRTLKTNKLPLYMYVLTNGRVLHNVLSQVLPFLIIKRNRARRILKYIAERGLIAR
jgi:hypothetical protein